MVFGLPTIGELAWGQKILDSINAIYDLAGSDSGWQTPTLLNSWVNYGGGTSDAKYRKIGNRVTIRGLIANGVIGSPVMTLPPGYEPGAGTYYTTSVNAITNAVSSVLVSNTGDVIVSSGTNTAVSLDDISFLVD